MESRKYPPYLFNVDFDALSAPPEPEVDEEPPAPTYSEAELQAARDAGFEAGKAEGVAQSTSGYEQQISQTVAALEQGFGSLRAAQADANEETMRDAVRVAATIAAKLFPDYSSRHGLGEIEAFVKETISTLFSEAEVILRVPEALADEIAARMVPTAAASGLGDSLKVVADPTLGPADCKMEWGNGGAKRDCAQLLTEIDTIVARFIEHSQESQAAVLDGQETSPAGDPVAGSEISPEPSDSETEAQAEALRPVSPEPTPAPTAAAEILVTEPVEPAVEAAPTESPPYEEPEIPPHDGSEAGPAGDTEAAAPADIPGAPEPAPEIPEPVASPAAAPVLPGAITADDTKQSD